jgi:hypothetical protein
MCPDLRNKRMIPIFGRPRARTLEEFGELVRHAGEEFIFVLTGRVEVHTEFYEPVIVESGQCMYIDSGMGHAYLLAPGCDEASAVSGCTSDDVELLNSLAKPEQRPDTAESDRKAPPQSVTKRPKKGRGARK